MEIDKFTEATEIFNAITRLKKDIFYVNKLISCCRLNAKISGVPCNSHNSIEYVSINSKIIIDILKADKILLEKDFEKLKKKFDTL